MELSIERFGYTWQTDKEKKLISTNTFLLNKVYFFWIIRQSIILIVLIVAAKYDVSHAVSHYLTKIRLMCFVEINSTVQITHWIPMLRAMYHFFCYKWAIRNILHQFLIIKSISSLYLQRFAICLSIALGGFVRSSFIIGIVFFLICQFSQVFFGVCNQNSTMLRKFVIISFVLCLTNARDFKSSNDTLVLTHVVSHI